MPGSMNGLSSLPIDLADPADIRAKLPAAEMLLEEMERAVAEQQREVTRWRELVTLLRSIANVGSEAAQRHAPKVTAPSLSPLQELVASVVDREIRKIRARDVAMILQREGHNIATDSVSNALWHAAEKTGQIQRTGHGFYAPLAYRKEEIGHSVAGQQGVPREVPTTGTMRPNASEPYFASLGRTDNP